MYATKCVSHYKWEQNPLQSARRIVAIARTVHTTQLINNDLKQCVYKYKIELYIYQYVPPPLSL